MFFISARKCSLDPLLGYECCRREEFSISYICGVKICDSAPSHVFFFLNRENFLYAKAHCGVGIFVYLLCIAFLFIFQKKILLYMCIVYIICTLPIYTILILLVLEWRLNFPLCTIQYKFSCIYTESNVTYIFHNESPGFKFSEARYMCVCLWFLLVTFPRWITLLAHLMWSE